MMAHLERSRSTIGFAAALLLGLFSTLSLSTPARAATKPVNVTAVRHWSLGDVTRVAVQATGEISYRFARLSNPDRIYFDIQNARQRLSRANDYSIDVNDGVVQRIRVAQNASSVVRVVLYLDGRLPVKDSLLSNPDRLVLEVRRPGAKPVSNTSKLPELSRTNKPKPPPARPRAAESKPPERKVARTTLPPLKPRVTQSRTTKPPTKPAPEPELEQKPPQPPSTEKPQRVETASAPPPPPSVKAEPSQPKPEPKPDEGRVATPAKRNRSGGRSLTRVLGLKLGRVVIDPGHGGRDTGTIGPSGLREKDVALDVAKRLAKLIEERLGSEAVLTRDEDSSLSLEARPVKANEAKADLFLSIHVNASRYRSVGGVETFYLNFTRSRADLEVAARENAGSSKSIHELSDLVRKIALDDKVQESRDFASSIQTAIHALAKKSNSRVKNRGVKKAPFVVLIGAEMPSALVELGFISNPREEKLMKSTKHRQAIAEALYKGIAAYASTLSHFQVASTNGGEE